MHILFVLLIFVIALGLFVAMLAFEELGRRIGERRIARDPDGARAGVGVVEGAVFGLLALLTGFVFSGAASRFDGRRQMVFDEVNAVGTAYLRIDVLADSAQPAIREAFRRYMDARRAAYQKVPDMVAARRELARADSAQADIWTRAVAASKLPDGGPPPTKALLLASLNEMFDIAEMRLLATTMHPPRVIYLMLVLAALASSLLVGHGMAGGRKRNLAFSIGFAATTAVALFVILELEYPRLGFVRVDDADQALVDLRARMR
jgi:hypothetical protein